MLTVFQELTLQPLIEIFSCHQCLLTEHTLSRTKSECIRELIACECITEQVNETDVCFQFVRHSCCNVESECLMMATKLFKPLDTAFSNELDYSIPAQASIVYSKQLSELSST
jgi:hypothetical protein